MANDFSAIGSAIYVALGGTAATPAAYYALAPQQSTPPYTIIQRQAAADEYTFTDGGISTDYVVKVVSNRVWPGEAYAAYGTVHATLQDAGLSITGYSALRCRRQTTIEYLDADRYWHVGGIYRIDAWLSS